MTDLLHAALQASGKRKADLARLLKVDRSAVTQTLEGNGNVTVNTLAEYLAVLGYEVDLQPVLLGEIVDSMREQRAPIVQAITQRDTYRTRRASRSLTFKVVASVDVAKTRGNFARDAVTSSNALTPWGEVFVYPREA